MQGDIQNQMINGIANSQLVLVFITSRYVDKVSGEDAIDNCKLEFDFAVQRKTSTRMLAVVLDPQMKNCKYWKGKVGMNLGHNIYVDMSGNLNNSEYFRMQIDQLVCSIAKIIGITVKNFPRRNEVLSALSSNELYQNQASIAVSPVTVNYQITTTLKTGNTESKKPDENQQRELELAQIKLQQQQIELMMKQQQEQALLTQQVVAQSMNKAPRKPIIKTERYFGIISCFCLMMGIPCALCFPCDSREVAIYSD